ncbi:F11 receptor, tandem duplicate 1 [Toxotes jaculatrix]|uniref:F11 receptor, tandem duplicate 1 n=1 Tax=Toxotes jaculatrix TaxID=941984 RepID=UPI001B3B18D6|nr:F11 receptor, tandem duplicate 1 [Toxotes jaculatrix]
MFVSGLVSVALFFYASTGVSGFTVTTSTQSVRVKENEGTDLKCSYSADFGSSPRVEWKFRDLKGSQTYVIFDGQPTTSYSGRVTLYGGSNLRISKVTSRDNGEYFCEVSSNGQFGEATVKLTVLVPPASPLCRIPSTVTTGKTTLLSCHDSTGSPPPTYRWYRDGTPLPLEPNKIAGFKNSTYRLNTENGNLEFPAVTKGDSGQYYCEAINDAGPPQQCKAVRMEVRDQNTAGIVAGVIVALLLLALLGVGIWYAHKKGYLPQKSKQNVVYQPQNQSLYGNEEDDGDFKQKSSFVV